MRVHITGNAGSGKSTFAKTIGDTLGIKVYGLDKVVWREGWRSTPLDERQRLEKELVLKSQWIIEGVSSIVREAADVIIFLDVPRRLSYFRCVKRNWLYLFSSRPDLPDNCPEIKIVPTLIKIIWDFPKRARPIILSEMNRQGKESFILSSNSEIAQFLSDLRRNKKIESTVRIDP